MTKSESRNFSRKKVGGLGKYEVCVGSFGHLASSYTQLGTTPSYRPHPKNTEMLKHASSVHEC